MKRHRARIRNDVLYGFCRRDWLSLRIDFTDGARGIHPMSLRNLVTLKWLLLFLIAPPAFATTYYVRANGGPRYDATNAPTGQCDGQGDAAYPGLTPTVLWTPSFGSTPTYVMNYATLTIN